MASGLRCQAMVGLPWSSTPVVTVIRSAMRVSDDLGDPVVDLLVGLVVAPAEAVADSGERVFGGGQGAVAGVGDGGGLLGGPDVGDAQPVGGTGVVVGDCRARAARLSTRCVSCSGSRRCRWEQWSSAVQRGQPVGHVGGEPLGPAGVGAQRHHEPQPGGVGGAQLAQVPEPGVDDADHAGRGQLADALERVGKARRLVGRARMAAGSRPRPRRGWTPAGS